MLKLAAAAFRGTNYLQLQYSYKSSTIDAAMRDTFCPVITFSGGVTKFVLHAIFYKKYISPKKMNSVQVLFMSALYVSTLFLSHKPLTFGILSYTTAFLCGVYCIIFLCPITDMFR